MEKQQLNGKVKGSWAYVIHTLCRNLELFISWFIFLDSDFYFSPIACSHDKDGRQMAGEPWGYGLRSRQKSWGLKRVSFCLRIGFCFLWLYLHEIVAVNYQVIVPTKRWLFCWSLLFLLLFSSISPIWHNLTRPLRAIAEMSSWKAHSSRKRIKAPELLAKPRPCLLPKYGSAKCTAPDCYSYFLIGLLTYSRLSQ